MDEKAISKEKNEWSLINKAGRAAAKCILSEYKPQSCLVFCGKGNNGRDGLICALTLADAGVVCFILLLGENRDEYQKIIHERNSNVKLFSINDLKNLPSCDMIIDALLGVGQNRNINGDYLKAVEYINSQNCSKIALDIPTGVNCDNGEILGNGIKCHKTYTFTADKAGLHAYPGKECSKEVVLLDIGISKEGEAPCGYTITDLSHLTPRLERGNKGTFGRVVAFVGSKEISGAAYFCGKSAYLCGAGLVEIVTHRANRDILSVLLPEAIITLYDEDSEIENIVKNAVNKADSIVIGCGLGISEISRRIVKCVAENSNVPTVYDADALNIFAYEGYEIACPEKSVFTPHMKEFSRITGCDVDSLNNSPLSHCVDYATKRGLVCLTKDANTIISGNDGVFYINTCGNNGMATGGSGDVLAGIIGGLLAYQSDNLPLITATGAFIHGKAGDLAKEALGQRSLLASDIMHHIPNVFINSHI